MRADRTYKFRGRALTQLVFRELKGHDWYKEYKSSRNLETPLGGAVEKMLTTSENRKVVFSSHLPPFRLPPVSCIGRAKWEPANK